MEITLETFWATAEACLTIGRIIVRILFALNTLDTGCGGWIWAIGITGTTAAVSGFAGGTSNVATSLPTADGLRERMTEDDTSPAVGKPGTLISFSIVEIARVVSSDDFVGRVYKLVAVEVVRIGNQSPVDEVVRIVAGLDFIRRVHVRIGHAVARIAGGAAEVEDVQAPTGPYCCRPAP